MTLRPYMVFFVLASTLFCTAGRATALTGTGDSPLFSLNTQYVSAVETPSELPTRDRLGGCFPNPFNPLTRIRFELARPTLVDLKVYDLQGRLVRVLAANELLAAGRYEAEWNGRDGRGAQVATGVYLYRLVTDSFSGSRRMTLMK
jgi:hypothetical protein